MNQGLIIVLPLVFFFLIDATLLVNSLRQRADSDTARAFSKLACCITLAQGLTAVTYACDWKMCSLSVTSQYIFNLVSLSCMTIAPYIWFRYLLRTNEGLKKYLHGIWGIVFFMPVAAMIAAGIPSQWTHWVFYIDQNGIYHTGTLFFLQFAGYVYYAAAIVLALTRCRDKKQVIHILYSFSLYMLPVTAGAVMNIEIYRGGYTQIGCSYAMFLLYLEQYITEVHENKRLKSVERLNDDLVEQVSIVGGLSNAYFSAYYVDLETGKCKAIKVIDFFRSVVKTCTSTDIVTKAFLAACVMPDDKKKMREFTNRHTLADRLRTCDKVVEEFHGTISPWEWCRASWIVSSRDQNGKAKSVLFTVEDITARVRERIKREQEREQAQKELEASRAAAEAANKAKSTFLFNMSHDIRTPMNAIVGYTELLQRHQDDREKREDYIAKIRSSSEFLVSLINNVLEMARIESGKVVLNEEPVAVGSVLNEVVSVYTEEMKKKNITFVQNRGVHTQYIYCDTVKFREIMMNLLSNAYKYTPSGGHITITTSELPCKKDGYTTIQIVVADTGIGMSEDYLPTLFDEFSRERTSAGNRIEGTGLGMAIVKSLTDLMGGTIEVESKLGKGTKFIVTTTHRIAQEEEVQSSTSAPIDTEALRGKRILLAEDNDLNAEIASEILKEYGFFIERAKDGIICIDMLRKAQADYYDAVLMDVQMPNMDGYQATRMIRQMHDPKRRNIPVIAMTANAFEEDKKNALAAGMNGHLAKPIEIPKLMQTLSDIL